MADKKRKSGPRNQVQNDFRFPVITGSGSCAMVLYRSGSHGRAPRRCKFLPKHAPVYAVLTLRASIKGRPAVVRRRLNGPAPLVHADDGFICCWFSRAIDLGDNTGNPAFWVLEKTAMDTWSLRLRRVDGEIAAYQAKDAGFPIILRKPKISQPFKFKWPAIITVSLY